MSLPIRQQKPQLETPTLSQNEGPKATEYREKREAHKKAQHIEGVKAGKPDVKPGHPYHAGKVIREEKA